MKRKLRFRAGDTAYVIVRNMEPRGSFRVGSYDATINRAPSTIIEFWTGARWVGGGTAAYREAKLYRLEKEAEVAAAELALTDPARFVGRLEVMEQVVWQDIWA